MRILPLWIALVLAIALGSCSKDNPRRGIDERTFLMGFSSWPYDNTIEAVDATYDFIFDNGDIYLEHLDTDIPWHAYINDLPLPAAYTADLEGKASRAARGTKLVVASGLLNTDRSDLTGDYEGHDMAYAINDSAIEEAYIKHLLYLIETFTPDYLIISIEANELMIHDRTKWEQYKDLMSRVRPRMDAMYPDIPMSESMTLHNYYKPQVADVAYHQNEITTQLNQMDFAAISFYPFFKQLHNREEFDAAFDFLHAEITVPIAMAETTHLAEDLIVPNLSLDIEGTKQEQDDYMQSLLLNANDENYEFVIWWTHRDFDALWATFPEEVRDLGQIWRDTGILDEDGKERPAFKTWKDVFAK